MNARNHPVVSQMNKRIIILISISGICLYIVQNNALTCRGYMYTGSLYNHRLSNNVISWNSYTQFRNSCSSNIIASSTWIRDDDFNSKAIHIVTSHCVGPVEGRNLTGRQLNRTEDAITMIKSAIYMTDSLLHIHVITDQNTYIVDQTKSWPESVRSRVKITFYEPCFPNYDLKAVFRLCSVQRLFIPYILDSIDKVIYTDTDSLFLGPVDHVWSIFHKFQSNQVLGMTQEILNTSGWYDNPLWGQHIPHLQPHGYNAGVLLMKLKKMRNSIWYNDIYEIVKRQNISGLGFNTLGDQDYLNEYIYAHRDQLFTLPCTVNYRSDFRLNKNGTSLEFCTGALNHGISLLHGNRQLFHGNGTYAILFNTIRKINWNRSHEHYISLVKSALTKEAFPHIFYKRLETVQQHNDNTLRS